VTEVATALNTMLDELEGAFQDREAAQDRLRRFVADASHELRTPLTSIQGYAELYRLADDPDEVDLQLILGRIEVESGRMRELVEDLLALARLEEGAPLTQGRRSTCRRWPRTRARAPRRWTRRRRRARRPRALTVVGDPRLLRRAIGNLVTNAVRHTPSGTRVEVTVRDLGADIEVVVRDHGPGIDPACCRGSSTGSSRASRPAARAGAGSGCPSCRRSPRSTADRSPPPTPPTAGPC
jgi:two-component system, OmpR family, sensor kinase